MLRAIGIFFGLLAAAFVVTGLILPSHFEFERSVVIKASPEQVHHFVGDLQQWPRWAPWQELDPQMKVTVSEQSQGVGAQQRWQGQSGSGELTFTQSDPATGITYDMSFGGDDTVYQAGMRYDKVADGTKVSWWMQGDMQPIIIGNYFAQLMEGFVAKDFERGLMKLKAVVEKAQ